MGWQFLSVDDRRQLTDELAELGLIQLGPTSRSALLNQAGLADLISRLDSLGNSSAQVFAAELVSTLENETTLPEQPHHQALGLLLDYVLSQSDTPQSTRAVCARLIGRYRLIDDEAVLAQLAAQYTVPETVTPWRDTRRSGRRTAVQKLNWLAVGAVVGALILAVAVFSLLITDGNGGIVLSTEYRVDLTIDDGCSADWRNNLASRIANVINQTAGERPVLFNSDAGEPDLSISLICDGADVTWNARWNVAAPIFQIVGSPREIQIDLASPVMADLELLGRALVYYGRGDYSLARIALGQAASTHPSVDLHWLYANSLLLTEDVAAIEAYSDLIPRMEGDALALGYNNRGLAHLDEAFRQEPDDYDRYVREGQTARVDLAQAQAIPATSAEVTALVNSNAGIAEAMLGSIGTVMDGAKAACGTAETAQPSSAWARICRAAVIIEPLKFERQPCKPDEHAVAGTLLDEAEMLQPELAALYYWQAVILFQRGQGCPPALTAKDFEAQCTNRRNQLALRRESGQAPLFFHQFLLNKFPNCAA